MITLFILFFPDWQVLPILAIYTHTLMTGDLELANSSFDYALKNLSNIEKISNTSGLVVGGSCLVDW